MGKFSVKADGNKVTAVFDGVRKYVVICESEADAALFVSEVTATQEDFESNGRDHAERKKYMYLSPLDCTVSVNLNIGRQNKIVKVRLHTPEEADQFYADLKSAVYGRMPNL